MGGRAGAGAGIGGVGLLIVLAVGYFAGIDVTPLLQGMPQQQSAPRELSPEEERAAEFSAQVLATTEEVWGQIFPRQVGRDYMPPVMVLYSGVTQSPCGGASGATGPFYCPADRKAYLDTEFFSTLSRELGARGDFAAAYVIAHEVAHHVQNELGILGQVNERRQAGGPGTGQRPDRAAGIAGRLPVGGLGTGGGRAAGAGRFERGAERGADDRRRPSATPRRPGAATAYLYPRHQRTARPLVHCRV